MDYIFNTSLKATNKRILNDGVYTIRFKKTNTKKLSINSSNLNNEISISSDDKTNQKFFIKYEEKYNFYTLIAIRTHQLLGIKKIYSESESPLVTQHIPSNDYLTEWNIEPTDDTYFQIILKDTELALEFNNEKNNLQLNRKSDTDDQQIYLKPNETIENGFYLITPKFNQNLFISFSKDTEEKNSMLSPIDYEKLDQVFWIQFDYNDGCYSIIKAKDGYCFSSFKESSPKSNIIQFPYINLDYQKWIISPLDGEKGDFIIELKSNFLRLGVSENTIQLQQVLNNDEINENQLFNLKRIQFMDEKSVEELNELIKTREEWRYKKRVLLTSDIKEINYDIFYNSYYIETLELPLSISKIPDDAFVNCKEIKTVICDPKWLNLFPNPLNIENILVPQGIESIDDKCFNNFHNLKCLSLPQSLNEINSKSFENVNDIRAFQGDPKHLKYINKASLINVIIPNYVTVIPKRSFADCKCLQKVEFQCESKLKEIRERAFENCKSLEPFTIPESVEIISPDAFYGCNERCLPILTENRHKNSMIENLVLDNKITDDFKTYCNIVSLEIPLEIEECEERVLESFTKLKYVKCDPKLLCCFKATQIEVVFIPDGINEISECEFKNMENLKFIEIPKSVEKINQDCFKSCTNLSSIKCEKKHLHFIEQRTIKTLILTDDGELQINQGDFDGFSNLESLILPEKVKINNDNVFIKCKKLKRINNQAATKLINNKMLIEEGVTSINKTQFEGWHNLNVLQIPKTVTNIENGTFDDCTNIEYLTCDPKWFHLFSKNTIRKITIPGYIAEISKEPFDGFHSLTCIELPNDISIKDSNVFDSCESLTSIRCNPLLLDSFSEKTRKHFILNGTIEYETPNYQNVEQTSYEIFDGKYNDFIENICSFVNSVQSPRDYRPKNSSVSEISKVCGFVCYKIQSRFNVTLNKSQLQAVLHLADEILNNEDSKGAIGEVKSSEGKSLIITILSIILVTYGRTVDIVNLNINFSKSEHRKYKGFFNLFKIETGVLCDINNDKENEFTELLDLNTQCNESNDDLFNCSVVYSTFENYELDYLNSLFNATKRSRPFDVVLVDEIDNMFNYEFNSPTKVECKVRYTNANDVFEIVFLLKYLKTSEIVETLNRYLPNIRSFEEENIQILKEAALEAIELTKHINYTIENDQVVFLDFISQQNEYLQKMIEIKEGLKLKPISITCSQISHHQYLNIYTKMSGITRSFGSHSDVEFLTKEYKINLFKIPCQLTSQPNISVKSRPDEIKVLFDLVIDEVLKERSKGHPVLVIWDCLKNATEFMNEKEFLLAQRIFGVDSELDDYAIQNIGMEESVTVATIEAIRGIDLSFVSEQLNVIVPMKLPNQRAIDDVIGYCRTVTFYISENDRFMKPTEFRKSDFNLSKIESNFSNYLKYNFEWMLSNDKQSNLELNDIFQYGTNYSDVLNALSRQFLFVNDAQKFKKLAFEMVKSSWCFFFNEIKRHADDLNYCESKYDEYLSDLNAWLQPSECKSIDEALRHIQSQLKDEKDLDYVIVNGIKISSSQICDILTKSEKFNWSQILNIDEKTIPNKFDTEKYSIETVIYNISLTHHDLTTPTEKWLFAKLRNTDQNSKKVLKSLNLPSSLSIEFINLAMTLSCEAYTGSFSEGEVVMSNLENDVFKPVFYCLEMPNSLCVVTRGSYSKKDWMTDFDCKEEKVEINGRTIYFHTGFYNSALFVLNSIEKLIVKTNKIVYFIGHSYGASVSNVLCLLSKSRADMCNKNIYSLSFGSAPSMSFCPPEIEKCILAFINRNDIVPSFCLFNTLNTAMKNHLSFAVFVKISLLILKPINNSWVKSLVNIIEENFELITEIIGILNVKKLKGVVFKIGDGSDKKKLKDCLVNDDQLPNTLTISFTSIYDHFIGGYEKSFKVIQS